MAPVLERLAKKNASTLRVIKVDAMKNKPWAKELGVRAVPSFRIYNGGVVVAKFEGGYPERIIQGKVDTYAKALIDDGNCVKDGNSAKGPAIRTIPKNWLPPGVTSE